jgi:hypothetical protein
VGVIEPGAESSAGDVGAYCRAVETHLCRKNDGHLIRVSGPAFDMVRGWAEQGIPLPVVFEGVDRTFERYYAKGPRRRPVHIAFCEADVLEAFDRWRRAIGVPALVAGAETEERARDRHASLPAHLERVIARLTARRAGGELPDDAHGVIDRMVRELDPALGTARRLRGEARAALIDRLHAIDRELDGLAALIVGSERRAALERDAAAQLEPFRERMATAAYEAALRDATARLLRDAARLPVARYDG